MLPIPPQLINTRPDITQRSMITFLPLRLRLRLTYPPLGSPHLFRTVPPADDLLDAADVYDPVVQMVDEFGHFFEEEEFVCVDGVAGEAGGVGVGDAIADVGEDGGSDGGVWVGGGGETGGGEAGEGVLVDAPERWMGDCGDG